MQAKGKNNVLERLSKLLRKDPLRWYSLTEIEDLGLIPWAKSDRTIRKVIDNDLRGEKLLGSRVVGTGKQRRYTIQAAGIIKYLEAYGPALMATVRKPKSDGKK